MAGYRGYLSMLASWPAAAPLLRDLRSQAGLAVDDGHDATATHPLLYRADGEPAACGRLLPDGRIGMLCLAAGASVADTGAVLLGYLAEQAQATGITALHITPPDGWRHLLLTMDPQARSEGRTLQLDSRRVASHWRLAGLDEAVLGETPIRWELQLPADYGAALLLMARQAQRSLRLFSPTLEHALFDNAHLADALSALARRSRHTEVRILITDPRPLVQRGHALLELHRRLSSLVPILKLPHPSDELEDTVLLADGCGLVVKPAREDDSGHACFHDKPATRALTETFDYLWQRGVSDPEIRGLAI